MCLRALADARWARGSPQTDNRQCKENRVDQEAVAGGGGKEVVERKKISGLEEKATSAGDGDTRLLVRSTSNQHLMHALVVLGKH